MKKEIQTTVLEGAKDIGNVLMSSEVVSPTFFPHYFNMKTGNHGIAALITEILTERNAKFHASVSNPNSELRKIAIAHAMFTREIYAEVERKFTEAQKTRYPYNTVELYVSHFMVKSGKIGKMQLVSKNGVNEDPDRKSRKPRCKYYLIVPE